MLDLSLFGLYCEAYHHWRCAVMALDKMAANDPLTAALMVKTKSGAAIENSLFLAARQSANDMLRIAAEFGMTPAARARLGNWPHGPKPPSKFAGLLAEGPFGPPPDRA